MLIEGRVIPLFNNRKGWNIDQNLNMLALLICKSSIIHQHYNILYLTTAFPFLLIHNFTYLDIFCYESCITITTLPIKQKEEGYDMSVYILYNATFVSLTFSLKKLIFYASIYARILKLTISLQVNYRQVILRGK